MRGALRKSQQRGGLVCVGQGVQEIATIVSGVQSGHLRIVKSDDRRESIVQLVQECIRSAPQKEEQRDKRQRRNGFSVGQLGHRLLVLHVVEVEERHAPLPGSLEPARVRLHGLHRRGRDRGVRSVRRRQEVHESDLARAGAVRSCIGRRVLAAASAPTLVLRRDLCRGRRRRYRRCGRAVRAAHLEVLAEVLVLLVRPVRVRRVARAGLALAIVVVVVVVVVVVPVHGVGHGAVTDEARDELGDERFQCGHAGADDANLAFDRAPQGHQGEVIIVEDARGRSGGAAVVADLLQASHEGILKVRDTDDIDGDNKHSKRHGNENGDLLLLGQAERAEDGHGEEEDGDVGDDVDRGGAEVQRGQVNARSLSGDRVPEDGADGVALEQEDQGEGEAGDVDDDKGGVNRELEDAAVGS